MFLLKLMCGLIGLPILTRRSRQTIELTKVKKNQVLTIFSYTSHAKTITFPNAKYETLNEHD